MNIPGYTYIAHILVPREWGLECRFTVKKGSGPDINDIVMADGVDEADLPALIASRLALYEQRTESIEILNADGTTMIIEVPA